MWFLNAGESPAPLASNPKDLPPHGNSVKGNVKGPSRTPGVHGLLSPPPIMMLMHMCSCTGSD